VAWELFWRRGGGVAGGLNILKYPPFFSQRRRPAFNLVEASALVSTWTLVQHDVGLIDRLRRGREGALRAR